jgi:ATP-binding cassette subfamily C (CFTR/MRP) protein 1
VFNFILMLITLDNSMRIVAPLVTFAVFVIVSKSTGQQLTTATAFTTLSLLELLSGPLNVFLRTIQLIHSALACFGRIQSFLAADSLQGHVLPLNASSYSSIKEVRRTTDLESENAKSIQLQDLGSNLTNRSAAMNVRNASFSWGNNAAPTINDVSFSIHRGDIVFVIGPVGCGKSTLLKGLMSETPSSQGFVYSSISEIAFVDQTPWVQNVTIQQNVVGPSILNQAWYDEVIHACALDHDIASMPKRDSKSKSCSPQPLGD